MEIKLDEDFCFYGGSVNAKNAKVLLKWRVDGLLIGKASRQLKEFIQIVSLL